MIEPGQTYDRAGVVAMVLRKRTSQPDDWHGYDPKAIEKMGGEWYDMYNLASDTGLPFHEPGAFVVWHESLFDPSRCKKLG